MRASKDKVETKVGAKVELEEEDDIDFDEISKEEDEKFEDDREEEDLGDEDF